MLAGRRRFDAPNLAQTEEKQTIKKNTRNGYMRAPTSHQQSSPAAVALTIVRTPQLSPMMTVGVLRGGCWLELVDETDVCTALETGDRNGIGPPMISGLTPLMRVFEFHMMRLGLLVWMRHGICGCGASFLTRNNMAPSRTGCCSWIDGCSIWPLDVTGVTVVMDALAPPAADTCACCDCCADDNCGNDCGCEFM